MPPTPAPVYQLRITLLGIKPPIWRQLHVPATMTLAELHDTIQLGMGWENGHLHEFRVGGERRIGLTGMDFMDPEDDNEDENEVLLSAVLAEPGQRMVYVYDFGDNWKHDVLLEAVHVPTKPLRFPVCIAGERACPPEDSGGVWGYGELLEMLKDTENPEYEERLEWLGDDFDPEAFDLAEVNRWLKKLR